MPLEALTISIYYTYMILNNMILLIYTRMSSPKLFIYEKNIYTHKFGNATIKLKPRSYRLAKIDVRICFRIVYLIYKEKPKLITL